MGAKHPRGITSPKAYGKHPSAVMESDGWSNVAESNRLLVELLKFLDVSALRERLLEAKLDVDGSREIVVERLKRHLDKESTSSSPSASGVV